MSADQPKESALRDDQVREALESALTVLELIAANRKGELMSNVETRHGSFVNVIDTILACRAALAATRPAEPAEPDLQARVQPWMLACFGAEIASDKRERNHRFLEEALELVQATGCTEDEARQLVAYVYSRPAGEPDQEVGGVMITLAALCLAQGLDMHSAGERELARIWTCVEKIRAKQAAKPRNSPLAEQARSASTSDPVCLGEACPNLGDSDYPPCRDCVRKRP